MNTLKNKLISSLISVSILAFISCKKDKDDVVPDHHNHNHNEEELITSLILNFTDSANQSVVKTFAFRDPDGEGGNAPTQFDTIVLGANTTYLVSLSLLNESVQPSVLISDEVLAEADEHLFCFENTGISIEIERTDSDGAYELGLESKWKTQNSGLGNVTIMLKHQPGVKDGSCSLGDTDVEVTFPVKVQ